MSMTNASSAPEGAAISFSDFGLPESIVQTLLKIEITTPTPIQAQAIPAAIEGKDVLATAQTGTGKTMAYLLPILTKMHDTAYQQALILAPTRELAEQIKNAVVQLLGRQGLNEVALLIGGAPIFKQFIDLKRRPRFIIGTPGRIIDHLHRGKLRLNDVKYLVLDEVDRMLDMGFSESLEEIMQHVPEERQTLMFSATMPTNIARLSQKYLKNPCTITIGNVTQAALQIKQESIKTTPSERFTHLLEALDTREGSVIIFVKTKIGADQLAERLSQREYLVDALHGDLKQRRREAVIAAYRLGRFRILVATDIAARGLDIPHIRLVINYDQPQCSEDYIHRIGRTGRAGMEGTALTFVLPGEGHKWRMIQRSFDPSFKDSGGGRDRGGDRRSEPRGDYRGDRSSGGSAGRSYGGGGGGGRGRSFGQGQGGGERSSYQQRKPAATGGRFSDSRSSDAPRGESRGGEGRGSEGRGSEGRGRSSGGRFGDSRSSDAPRGGSRGGDSRGGDNSRGEYRGRSSAPRSDTRSADSNSAPARSYNKEPRPWAAKKTSSGVFVKRKRPEETVRD